jgi:hypothetical protein
VPLKIQISDETPSHSTRPPKNGSQVSGYKPNKARKKIAAPHILSICKQDFLSATQYDDETLGFKGRL